MVYCTKCGTENPDDAEVCKNCGASLTPYTFRPERRDYEIRHYHRRGTIWPLVIGAFLILWGLSSLFEGFYWLNWDRIWPLFLIVIGLIIVGNAFNRRR